MGQAFWNSLWQLLSPLNMEPVCISSYSWVIYLSLSHTNSMCRYNFLFQSKSALISVTFCSWYSSSQCYQVSCTCLIMFKGKFTSNHPSTVLQVFISCVSPYSFDSPSYITLLCLFCVDDGGYIKALFLSTLAHHLGIILRKQLVPRDLHASMASLLTSNNSLTSLTYDRMFPRMFDLNSFIHICWNALGYLGSHNHHW
jgi:hypothetical protein